MVVFLYLDSPEPSAVKQIFEHVLASGISADAFGLRDPPKKWSGDTKAMSELVLGQQERTKCCFLRDRKAGIDLSLELHEKSWGFSTLSLSTTNEPTAKSVGSELARRLNPFLAICGTGGGGKGQAWTTLYEREDCPAELRALLVAG